MVMAPPRDKKKPRAFKTTTAVAAVDVAHVSPAVPKGTSPKVNGKQSLKAAKVTNGGRSEEKQDGDPERTTADAGEPKDETSTGQEPALDEDDASTDAESNFHDADAGQEGEKDDDSSASRDSLTETGHILPVAGSDQAEKPRSDKLSVARKGDEDPSATAGSPSFSVQPAEGSQAANTASERPGSSMSSTSEPSVIKVTDHSDGSNEEASSTANEFRRQQLPSTNEDVPADSNDSIPRLQQPLPQTPDLAAQSSASPSSSTAKRSLWGMLSPRGSSQGVGTSPTWSPSADFRPKLAASLSNSLSSFTAGLSAVRRGSVAPASSERVRLPRREVDEAQLAEDVMRFADARHVLRTVTDGNRLRDLGIRLEEGWREKLAEAQSLRARLEEAQDTLEDLEDENEHLRTQLGTLSEQIAAREDAFEQLQRSTIEHQTREKSLWREEAREERENVLFQVAEAQRQLAEERAVTAQLRIVLQSAKSGRIDVLDSIDTGDGTSAPAEIQDKPSVDARQSPESGAVLRRQSQSSESKLDQDCGEKVGDEIQNDVLFNLSHSPTSSKRSTSLFSEVHTLHGMRGAGLLAGAIAEEEGKTYAIATQVLFDKAAADGALTKALQEENNSLRSYVDAKDRRCTTLQLEVEELQTRLVQTESAIAELLDTAPPV
ncbi:hypothetical protein K437DRAFT_264455 [Tilletiaria anomala UBC 951]|uniref:Uncharacterized protein n=1 Tax=Tilletiaria anomala (strain ATCC 24038 / CBS 436.72 / UBC 951) TaxID=1037660 RepID=A0A066VHV1_TILAU|nr:uncharacterized protein K437DRAFT_264455 [Tilletiaria anomala UBC 951]KDN39848.1 hypothetical protein K437DRAFT_264455 [Tilletiaria anomala UBC 951]